MATTLDPRVPVTTRPPREGTDQPLTRYLQRAQSTRLTAWSCLLGLTLNLNRVLTPLCIELGERDGINYHFITLETFNGLLRDDLFKEHGDYKGQFYGTLKPSASSFTEIYNTPATNGVKLNGSVSQNGFKRLAFPPFLQLAMLVWW
jgi:hypothetical protein